MTRAGRDRAVAVAVIAVGLAVVYRGMFAGHVLGGRDIFRLFLPQGFFLRDCLERGEIPLWNPNVWLGQPFAATLQSEAFYPVRLFFLAFVDYVWVSTVQHVAHAAIAAGGVWFLCRRLGASRGASLAAGLAFGLGPMFTILNNTPNLVAGLAWSGWLLGAVHAHCDGPNRKTTALIAIVAAVAFLAGSPEMVLWQSALAIGAAAAWSRGQKRMWIFTIAAFAWAVAATAFVFFPAVELALLSTRVGATDQLLWSVSWAQLFSAALPAFDMPRGAYLGRDQWLLGAQFLGTLTCAAACCVRLTSRPARPFIAGAVLLFALSLGENLWPAARVLELPPFSLFRYPAKYYLGAAFCVCVLAALGLDRLAARARRLRPRPIAAGVIVVVLFGLLALTPLLPVRKDAHLGPPWLLMVLATAGVLLVTLPKTAGRGRAFRRAFLAVGFLELLIAHAGLWKVSWVDPARLRQPSALGALIERPARLSFEPQAKVETTGEDPAAAEIEASRDRLVPLRHLEEGLLGFEGYEPPIPRLANQFRYLETRGVYDLAGIGYFTRPPDVPKPYDDLEELGRGPGGIPVLYRSTTAMPRAFVVHRSVIATDDQMIAALEDPAQPARTTAFLEAGEPLEGADCTGSSALLQPWGNSELRLTVNACARGYLVVSDAWFPGWYATVNGAFVPIERANLALRAVKVPAGRSDVVMAYHPKSFAIGIGFAAPAVLVMVISLRRRKGA